MRDGERVGGLGDEVAHHRRIECATAVARLGGNPEDDGTTAGAVHRGWINLKEAVLGRDDEATVNSVESGEDYLKDKFETALKNTDLPAEARGAVEQAWQSVKSGHDQMSQLKHAIS